MSGERKLHDAPESEVIEGAGCTWCGAEVGVPCQANGRGSWRGGKYDLPGGPGTAHAQRWRDYWNETHGPDEQMRVSVRGDRA